MALPTLITFVAGEDALAEDVNANFDAIAGRFNGGILDQDISDSAAIKGYKLASAAGDRVPETRLENNAVSARVLQSDASTGAPLAAVASAAHIKDGIITKAKLASGAGNLVVVTKTFTTAVVYIFDQHFQQATITPDVNYAVASYDLVACYVRDTAASGAILSVGVDGYSGGTNWAATVRGITVLVGSITGTAVLVFQAKV